MRSPIRSSRTRERRRNRLLKKNKIKLLKWQFKVSWQGEHYRKTIVGGIFEREERQEMEKK
jgi:hypothetical protein